MARLLGAGSIDVVGPVVALAVAMSATCLKVVGVDVS